MREIRAIGLVRGAECVVQAYADDQLVAVADI